MKHVLTLVKNNKTTLHKFIAFTALYFLHENILWLANFRFEEMFYPLIPLPHDWEVYSFIEHLDYWGKWMSWAGFIATAAGLGIWMLAGKKLLRTNTCAYIYGISLILTVIFIAILFFAEGVAAFAGFICAMFFTSCALGLFLWELTEKIPLKNAGMFIVCAIVLKNLIFDMAVLPYFWQGLSAGALVALLFACAVSAVFAGGFYKAEKMPENETAADNMNVIGNISADTDDTSPPPRIFMIVLFIVIFMSYVITNIAQDQLFVFMDAYIEIPYFGFILIVLNYVFFILAGYLFDKNMRINGFLIGTMCVGVNLTMVLFLKEAQLSGAVWMSVLYNVLRDFGGVMLSAFTITAPVYYTALGGRGVPPQTGLFMFALCAFAVPALLNATRPILNVVTIFNEQYNPVLGIALLLTFGTLALVFVLFRIFEKYERTIAIDAVTAGKLIEVVDKFADPVDVDTDVSDKESIGNDALQALSPIRRKLIAAAVTPLTERELEVAELTVLGIKRKIIAETLFIQSSTVDTHRISIYNKFGVHTRDELLKILSRFN